MATWERVLFASQAQELAIASAKTDEATQRLSCRLLYSRRNIGENDISENDPDRSRKTRSQQYISATFNAVKLWHTDYTDCARWSLQLFSQLHPQRFRDHLVASQ
jgi:hypothetical protein